MTEHDFVTASNGVQIPLPALPALPPLVKYFDRFGRCEQILRNPATEKWVIPVNGQNFIVDIDFGHAWIESFIKGHLVDILTRGSVITVQNYYRVFCDLNASGALRSIIFAVATEPPSAFQNMWIDTFRNSLSRHQAVAIRSALRFACEWGVGQWRSSDVSLVRSLPGHELSKYAGVRDGSSMVATAQQSMLTEFLDQTARNACRLRGVGELQAAGVLALAFQFGLRRTQIASLEKEDFVFHSDDTLHVRVELLKQRGQKVGRTVNRRIQTSWVPIFKEWSARRRKPAQKFFDMTPDQVGAAISSWMAEITGKRHSGGDLRHTSAQRLVDAGVSRESLTDFLGHTDVTTANVYFSSSSTQASLVNAAMGYSPAYQGVAAAARGDLITAAELLSRPIDQQIAGIPHGFPITGIGACKAGQSSCQRNPVLACYTCHKFLPVSEERVHRLLLEDMREVVRRFDQPERIARVSPAMMQLRLTLEAIEEVAEMAREGGGHDD